MMRKYTLLLFLTLPFFLLANNNAPVTHHLITSIGICIIASTVTGYFGYLFKQPLILMYIAAGVIIGPQIGLALISSQAEISIISEIGLILLLFMIGLEIDVKKLMESGKTLILSGIFQFIISFSLGYFFLNYLGFANHSNRFDLIYIAFCISISSTTIVVKVLYSKFELDTLAGHITLGVLIFQDIWAILFLSTQPNLSNPELNAILLSFLKGFCLIAISLGISKYILPKLFKSIARLPELVLVSSLGWCFFICGVASYLNLSVEMGALIAGVSISTFPYNIDVIAKVTNIRDFFITLFFVALGMQIPNPLNHLSLLSTASIVVLFVIAARFVSLYPLLYGLKNGHRVSILTSINLSNVSEFSLVICTLGLSYNHISKDLFTTVVFIFVISSILAPYFIKYSNPIQKFLTKLFLKIGLKDISIKNKRSSKKSKDIAILGVYREASSLIKEIEEYDKINAGKKKYKLKKNLVVVDFNPDVHHKLQTNGIDVIYGDISSMDTLHHANIHHSKIIISTIPDSLLVGTDNLKLIKKLKSIAPKAKIIVTAESIKRAINMYNEGADHVLLPRVHVAQSLMTVLLELINDKGSYFERKQAHIEHLKQRKEVIN